MNQEFVRQIDKHKEILSAFTFNQYSKTIYSPKKIERRTGIIADEGVNIFETQNELISGSGQTLFPEFVEYCYFLEGCPKKLLLFLVFHHVNHITCEFLYNAETVHDFNKYNSIMADGKSTYKPSAIKGALQTLVNSNLIGNLTRGKYMLNPMIMGGTGVSQRVSLINKYSQHLFKKKRTQLMVFYPNSRSMESAL